MADRVVLGIAADLGAGDREWRFRAVDRDEIDSFPGKLGAAVELGIGGTRFAFQSIDDLHPDGIVARVPELAKLLEARKAAGDANRVRRLAEEAGMGRALEALLGAPPASPRATAAPSPGRESTPEAVAPGDLLDSVLDRSAAEEAPSADPVDRIIREAAKFAVPADTATEKRHRLAVDRILGEHARAVLEDRAFRSIEAAWRSLRALVIEAETGPALRIVALPVREAELRADLAASTAAEGRLDRAIGALREGGSPLDALFVDMEFGPDEEELRRMVGLAAVAHRAGCPAIAAARPELAGVEGAAGLRDAKAIEASASAPGLENWRKFRASSLASRVGLCLPRILLRLPYGPGTAEVESFEFDEGIGGPDSSGYLWGNPALALARVAAAAFAIEGRGARLGPYAELSRLPICAFEVEGETVRKGPTEVEIPESAAVALRSGGFMPLQSIRGSDTARFFAIQSASGTALF